MKENEEMTPRECEKYAALIDGAYPQPSDGLKDAVMARISAEKAARRRRQRALIRWGSIAACLVIVAGAVFAVMPKLSLKKALVDEDYAFCEDSCDADEAPQDTEENAELFCGIMNIALAPSSETEEFEEGHIQASNGAKTLYDTRDECASNDMPNIIPESSEPSPLIITSAEFDIDGDGEVEYCEITPGPTSGLYSIWFTVYSADGEEKYKDCFVTGGQAISFEENNGKTVLNDGGHYHGIEILDGHVSLPTDCEDCMISGPVE